MDWRDGFTARASFRGVEFWLRDDELAAGRRVQVHEYPLRDKPYVEDLGRKARRYQIEGYLIGDDYLLARDALIAEFERPGKGTLIHPYYGRLSVTLAEPARVRQSTREGGFSRVTMQFVEGGDQVFPVAVANSPALVVAAADLAEADAINAFADGLSIDAITADLASFVAEVESVFSVVTDAQAAVEGLVDDAIGAITDTVTGLAGDAAAAIRAPFNIGSSIIGAINNIASIITEPMRAINLYRDLFGAGDDVTSLSGSTRTRRVQLNQHQLNQLVRTGSVVAASRVSSQVGLVTGSTATGDSELVTANAALALRDELVAQITTRQLVTDPLTLAPIADPLYLSLTDLRVAVLTDLSDRGQRLPSLVGFTPRAELPALVLAHQLYGDASRGDELIALNNIRHPGFVPAGTELQALVAA